MRFKYTPYEGSWLPLVPVALKSGRNELPPVGALVDTGASHTVLPMELATALNIAVDVTDGVETQVAGGGLCSIYPSPTAVEYILRDSNSNDEYRWRGLVFFALGQRLVLLGHHQCLEKFDVTCKGPEKLIDLTPRFRRK